MPFLNKFLSLLLFIAVGAFTTTYAQENSLATPAALPDFTAKYLGNNKCQISWVNGFEASCTQISVQKSYDSLRFFQTIFSAQSPELPQNGFVDNHSLPEIKTYYRIFYVLSNGTYFFTDSKSVNDTKTISQFSEVYSPKACCDTLYNNYYPFNNLSKNYYSLYLNDTTKKIAVLHELMVSRYKDSVETYTKDAFYPINDSCFILKKFGYMPQWLVSKYVYTNNKGHVCIKLPQATANNNYKLVIFNEAGVELYKLKQINTDFLYLDKSNFWASGFYYFDLYEQDKLIEKNKFFIEK